ILENENQQQIASTKSDHAGAFSFLNVPSGPLFVLVQEAQFAPVRIEVPAGDSDITKLQITLKIAEVKESVVVTVTRSERSLADQPASVSLINEQQIEQTPANSMDDVLRTVPSVNLPMVSSYQVHPTANSISMRGLGGIRALVLLDGVPINDPFFGYLQWSRVSMESVDRVEVVRGGGSPLWGNYAMGGVINIITRPPDKTDFKVEAGYGRFDTYRANGTADYVVNDTFKLRAVVDTWGTNGFDQVPPDAGPIYVPTTFDGRNIGASAYLTPDSNWHGSFNFNFHDNDQTLLTPLSTNDQQIYDLAGNFVRNFEHSDLTISGFYEHSHFVTDNTGTPDGVEIGFGEFLQNRHTTPVDSTGASANWTMPMDGVIRLLTFGTDMQLISGEDSAQIFDESGTQIRTDIGRGKQFFLGGFGQIDIFPSENFEILASARIQNVRNYDGFDGVGGLGNVPDNSDVSFDPRVSIHYNITSQFALRGAAYTSFRAPNLDNLYRAFSVPFGIFEPNAQLKPEKLKGGELGFDIYQSSLAFQFTGYISEIEDLLTYRNLDFSELPPGFFFGSRNINAGKARAQGVEAT
ncbi:MAG TPA: TonB-dependent receptor, partial [Acidobacteriota bacterium]